MSLVFESLFEEMKKFFKNDTLHKRSLLGIIKGLLFEKCFLKMGIFHKTSKRAKLAAQTCFFKIRGSAVLFYRHSVKPLLKKQNVSAKHTGKLLWVKPFIVFFSSWGI